MKHTLARCPSIFACPCLSGNVIYPLDSKRPIMEVVLSRVAMPYRNMSDGLCRPSNGKSFRFAAWILVLTFVGVPAVFGIQLDIPEKLVFL